jgi:hypothetical protein
MDVISGQLPADIRRGPIYFHMAFGVKSYINGSKYW